MNILYKVINRRGFLTFLLAEMIFLLMPFAGAFSQNQTPNGETFATPIPDHTNPSAPGWGDFDSVKPGDWVVFLRFDPRLEGFRFDSAMVLNIGVSAKGIPFLEFQSDATSRFPVEFLVLHCRTMKIVAMIHETFVKMSLNGNDKMRVKRASPFKYMPPRNNNM